MRVISKADSEIAMMFQRKERRDRKRHIAQKKEAYKQKTYERGCLLHVLVALVLILLGLSELMKVWVAIPLAMVFTVSAAFSFGRLFERKRMKGDVGKVGR